MNYIYVGEVVNTHGIKGELRVISNFNYKDKVFVKGMLVYLGLRKQKMTIASYRKHKNFALITLEGINDIMMRLLLKEIIYILKEKVFK